MDAIRAFIAVELPETLRKQLDGIESMLQSRLGEQARRSVRWVPASSMHLTLKFLGEVSTANVEVLARMLKNEAARHAPFSMTVGGLGAFPNPRRPRVIWVGTEAPAELGQLQHAIEAEARQLGYPVEERPFSPHLTLGRVTQNARPEDVSQLARVLGEVSVDVLGTVPVDRVHLFRSDLRPTGAVYTSLYSFSFSEPAAA